MRFITEFDSIFSQILAVVCIAFLRYLVDRFKFISIYCVCQRVKRIILTSKIRKPRQDVARKALKIFFQFRLDIFEFVESKIRALSSLDIDPSHPKYRLIKPSQSPSKVVNSEDATFLSRNKKSYSHAHEGAVNSLILFLNRCVFGNHS